MTLTTVANRGNLELIEDYYQMWRHDPGSVDPSWQHFFEGYELGQPSAARRPRTARARRRPRRPCKAVTRLVDAYREIGHYLADLDPLKLDPHRESHELLELSAFGLSEADLDRVFFSRL